MQQEVSIKTLDVDLTETERELLGNLMSRTGRIDVIIPKTADGKEVWGTLQATCKVLSSMRQAANQLKPLLGRLIVEVQKRPELYKEHGYVSFNDFMTRGMSEMLGVSRADAYQMKRLVENLPWLTAEDFADVGYSKLQLVASDAVAPRAKDIIPLIRSKEITVPQARAIIEDKKLIEKGELEVGAILITTSKANKTIWEEFVADPAIQEYAETKSPGGILMRLIEECRGQWMAHTFRDRVLNDDTG